MSIENFHIPSMNLNFFLYIFIFTLILCSLNWKQVIKVCSLVFLCYQFFGFFLLCYFDLFVCVSVIMPPSALDRLGIQDFISHAFVFHYSIFLIQALHTLTLLLL